MFYGSKGVMKTEGDKDPLPDPLVKSGPGDQQHQRRSLSRFALCCPETSRRQGRGQNDEPVRTVRLAMTSSYSNMLLQAGDALLSINEFTPY